MPFFYYLCTYRLYIWDHTQLTETARFSSQGELVAPEKGEIRENFFNF